MNTFAEEVQVLREALQRVEDRYNYLARKSAQLALNCERLCLELSTLCEAHLAGDTETVKQRLGMLSAAYLSFTQPIGRTH